MKTARRTRIGERCAHTRGGFSLLEVTVAIVVLLVALGGLSGTVLSTTRLSRSTEELAVADAAARQMAAELRATTFADVFAAYNQGPFDDPDGIGTGPGANFVVEGLTPRRDDPDGLVGRIVFPTREVAGVEELREDLEDDALGMPRDLDGDGLDADDHSTDYLVLPVSIVVEWIGAAGEGEVRLDLILTE